MSRAPLLIFCVLTIRKHLLKMRLERSGRGQEPSRGHKFSILENFLAIRDFASQTLASFLSDLVGACLPQTLLRTDEEESCQFDTIPLYCRQNTTYATYFKIILFSGTPTEAPERFSILWASWQCPPTPAGYAPIRHLSYQWYWPGYPATAGCCCPWSWVIRPAHDL